MRIDRYNIDVDLFNDDSFNPKNLIQLPANVWRAYDIQCVSIDQRTREAPQIHTKVRETRKVPRTKQRIPTIRTFYDKRYLWKVCKNGSISMGNRGEGEKEGKRENEKKDCRCTRILYPCQWRRNVVARLSLLWKSMAAFIPITMASVQTRLYRSWNPGGRNERNMFTIIIWSRSLPCVPRREITAATNSIDSKISKTSGEILRHAWKFSSVPYRRRTCDSFYPSALVENY